MAHTIHIVMASDVMIHFMQDAILHFTRLKTLKLRQLLTQLITISV